MGTHINVTIEHHVRNYRDPAAMVELLAPTVPAAMAVADYWRSEDDKYSNDPRDVFWDWYFDVLPRAVMGGSWFATWRCGGFGSRRRITPKPLKNSSPSTLLRCRSIPLPTAH